MKLVILGSGTSQGVPAIGCKCEVCTSSDPKDSRLRSSAIISINGFNILIDIGVDFRQQVLREGITKIDAVLITHEHKDHTNGLDDIKGINYLMNKPIDVYSEKRVLEDIKKSFAYIFSENKYPGIPSLNLHQINAEEAFYLNDNKIKVQPIRVMHYKLPILGYRIQDITYITDANYISNNECKKAIGSKILVVNSLRMQSHMSHFSLPEAIEFAQKVNADKTYFTHISHKLGLHNKINPILPDKMELAYDGLAVEL